METHFQVEDLDVSDWADEHRLAFGVELFTGFDLARLSYLEGVLWKKKMEVLGFLSPVFWLLPPPGGP